MERKRKDTLERSIPATASPYGVYEKPDGWPACACQRFTHRVRTNHPLPVPNSVPPVAYKIIGKSHRSGAGELGGRQYQSPHGKRVAQAGVLGSVFYAIVAGLEPRWETRNIDSSFTDSLWPS